MEIINNQSTCLSDASLIPLIANAKVPKRSILVKKCKFNAGFIFFNSDYASSYNI
jgi:hypothetical protein